MIEIDIPDFRALRLQHLVLDYNGTLAADGQLLPGVAAALRALAGSLRIHVVTADTFGLAQQELDGLPVEVLVLPPTGQADAKRAFVVALGADSVVAIGNGRNDCRMLEVAALGVALIQREGAAVATLTGADVAATGILDALELLQVPKRLVATLRS